MSFQCIPSFSQLKIFQFVLWPVSIVNVRNTLLKSTGHGLKRISDHWQIIKSIWRRERRYNSMWYSEIKGRYGHNQLTDVHAHNSSSCEPLIRTVLAVVQRLLILVIQDLLRTNCYSLYVFRVLILTNLVTPCSILLAFALIIRSGSSSLSK